MAVIAAIPRWIRHLAALAFLVLFWTNVCAWMVTSGTLWLLIGDRLAKREDQSVAAALFRQQAERPHDVIVIGDGLFLDRFRARQPDTSLALEVTIPRVHIRYIADVLQVLARLPYPAPIIIQSSPYLWSNLERPGGAQNLSLWTAAQKPDRLIVWPEEETKLFFTALGVWAATADLSPYPTSQRPGDLSRVGFKAYPYYLPRLQAAVQGSEGRLIWVADRDSVPYESAKGLVEGFDRVIHNSDDPERPGLFVEWDGLEAALRRVKGRT